MAEKSVEEHAKDLRNFAELTAKNSNNWGNFERICNDYLIAAFNAGRDGADDGKGN